MTPHESRQFFRSLGYELQVIQDYHRGPWMKFPVVTYTYGVTKGNSRAKLTKDFIGPTFTINNVFWPSSSRSKKGKEMVKWISDLKTFLKDIT